MSFLLSAIQFPKWPNLWPSPFYLYGKTHMPSVASFIKAFYSPQQALLPCHIFIFFSSAFLLQPCTARCHAISTLFPPQNVNRSHATPHPHFYFKFMNAKAANFAWFTWRKLSFSSCSVYIYEDFIPLRQPKALNSSHQPEEPTDRHLRK